MHPRTANRSSADQVRAAREPLVGIGTSYPAHHAAYGSGRHAAHGYVAEARCSGMMSNMAGRAPLNRPQSGNQTTYDIDSGRPYRTGVTFQPEEAVKIVTAANRMGFSVSGLINELTKRMAVDKHGLPVWYEAPEEQQQSLIA
jgi:hypothetical protein